MLTDFITSPGTFLLIDLQCFQEVSPGLMMGACGKEHLLAALKEIAVNQGLKLVDIIELVKEFGVSSEAVLWRFVNLKNLKKSQVEKIISDFEFRNLDRGLRRGLYAEQLPEKFPQRYVSLACRCLMEGKISRGLFAEYMEIDRSEIDDYLSAAGYAVKL